MNNSMKTPKMPEASYVTPTTSDTMVHVVHNRLTGEKHYFANIMYECEALPIATIMKQMGNMKKATQKISSGELDQDELENVQSEVSGVHRQGYELKTLPTVKSYDVKTTPSGRLEAGYIDVAEMEAEEDTFTLKTLNPIRT